MSNKVNISNSFLIKAIVITIVAFIFQCTQIDLQAQSTPNEKLAIQYYQNGEYEKAKELFQDLFSKKQDSYIYFYYFRTLLELKEYKELEKVVKKQQKAYPNFQRYSIDLGYVYEMAGEMKDATKVYEEAIKKVPNTENGYRELSNAFVSFAKREYAEQVLMKGRKMLNNQKLFSREITQIYQQLNLTEKIIEESLNLVSDDDENYLGTSQDIIQNLLLDDADNLKHQSVKTILKKAIQKEPNNGCFLKLYYWISLLNKDYDEALILAKAIDKRAKIEGEVLIDFSKITKENRAYEISMQSLNAIIVKGEKTPFYSSAQFELLNVKYLILTSTSPVKIADAIALEKEFKKLIDEYGIHSGTSEWTRKYAHLLAFYVNKPQDAILILETAIKNADKDLKEKAVYKVDLADIMLHVNEIWEATLLYSQVDKDFPNDTIGHIAKFKNAKLSFYIGEFSWAKSQLDVLRAATSKFISNDAMYLSFVISDNEEEEEEIEEDDLSESLFNDQPTHNIALRYFAKADFMLFQNNDKEAIQFLDSVLYYAPLSSLNDDILYIRANIATRQKDYFAAEKYYKEILENYATDLLGDDALFKLAELYEYYLRNIPEAMVTYQKLLKEHPSSLYVVDARKRFRYLRGDNID